MKFNEANPDIFVAHKKAKAVILSCKNLDQIEVASNYVENFKRFCSRIECVNQLQRDFVSRIIDDTVSTLRIKRKSIQ